MGRYKGGRVLITREELYENFSREKETREKITQGLPPFDSPIQPVAKVSAWRAKRWYAQAYVPTMEQILEIFYAAGWKSRLVFGSSELYRDFSPEIRHNLLGRNPYMRRVLIRPSYEHLSDAEIIKEYFK